MWEEHDSATGVEVATAIMNATSSARPRPHATSPQNQQPLVVVDNNDSSVPKISPPPVVNRPPIYSVIPTSGATAAPQIPHPLHIGVSASQTPTVQTTAATAPTLNDDGDSAYMQTSSALAQHYPAPRTMTIESNRSVDTRRVVNVIDGGVVSTPAGWPAYLAAPPVSTSRRIVKQRDLPIYLAFSIVATILFFPTGIIALFHAVKLRRAFIEGVYANDLQEATKIAKNCEKCLLLTLVLAFVVGFLIFGLVDYYSVKGSRDDMTKTTTRAMPLRGRRR